MSDHAQLFEGQKFETLISLKRFKIAQNVSTNELYYYIALQACQAHEYFFCRICDIFP